MNIPRSEVLFIAKSSAQVWLIRRMFEKNNIDYQVLSVDESQSREAAFVCVDLVSPMAKSW